MMSGMCNLVLPLIGTLSCLGHDARQRVLCRKSSLCWLAQVKCHACVGGTSVRDDTRILQAGVHVVVGTPGRVYDMLRRRALRADRSAAVR